MKEFIQEMEEYARNKNVTIIEKDSIKFLMKYIKLHKVKNILEGVSKGQVSSKYIRALAIKVIEWKISKGLI